MNTRAVGTALAGLGILCGLGAAPETPQPVTKVVVKFDSPQLAPNSSDRLPKTIWRSGKNKVRIEGVVSAETGHHMLMVTDSPNLWFADLDTHAGYHTLDTGPDIGASVPVFPVPGAELEGLEFGGESAYFRSHNAKSLGLVTMNGRSCQRQDIETKEYVLIGCFESMTARPVVVGLRVGDKVYAFNYLEYERNAPLPEGGFQKPAGIKFTERVHEETTVAH
jgi:hypothetical protein